jgi:hypothetical protein
MAQPPHHPPAIPDLELGAARPVSQPTRVPAHLTATEPLLAPGELDPEELSPGSFESAPLELRLDVDERVKQPVPPAPFTEPEPSAVLAPRPLARASFLGPSGALAVLSLERRLLRQRARLSARLAEAEGEWFERAEAIAASLEPEQAPSSRSAALLAQFREQRAHLASPVATVLTVRDDSDELRARVASSDKELIQARASEESADLELRRTRGRYQRAQIELRAEQTRSNPPSEKLALERLSELSEEIANAEARAISANRSRIALERATHALRLELRHAEDRVREASANRVGPALGTDADRRLLGNLAIQLVEVWTQSLGGSAELEQSREFQRCSREVAALRDEVEGLEHSLANLGADAARRRLLVGAVLLGLALVVLVLWLG